MNEPLRPMVYRSRGMMPGATRYSLRIETAMQLDPESLYNAKLSGFDVEGELALRMLQHLKHEVARMNPEDITIVDLETST